MEALVRPFSQISQSSTGNLNAPGRMHLDVLRVEPGLPDSIVYNGRICPPAHKGPYTVCVR